MDCLRTNRADFRFLDFSPRKVDFTKKKIVEIWESTFKLVKYNVKKKYRDFDHS